MEQNKKLIKELQHVGSYMMNKELAWGNSGNISARFDSESCLITASGTYLGELAQEDLVHYYFGDDGATYSKKPSKEIPMHQAIYEERPEINAVLHASPLYSTIVACSDLSLPSNLFVESMYYLEKVIRIPYFHPGSKDLGEAVRKVASKTNIIVLENHGVLVYDVSIKEARMALETLEMVSKIMVMSHPVQFKSLPSQTVQDFLEFSGYKPRRKWGSE